VARGKIDDLLSGEGGDPRAVVEDLRDHVARCLLALELENVQAAVGVDGKQIDELPVRRPHLPPNDQQSHTQQGRILLQEVLECRLGWQGGRAQRPRPLTVEPPHPHLDRHRSQLPLEGAGLEGVEYRVLGCDCALYDRMLVIDPLDAGGEHMLEFHRRRWDLQAP